MENISIIRSNRKTIAVEIRRDLSVVVRAPFGVSLARINAFVLEKSAWIEKHLEIVKKRNYSCGEKAQISPYTDQEIRQIKAKARSIIPAKLSLIAKEMGASYGRVALRFQASRWGSCSTKGNLNFNCLLALCPEEVMDYVIIHELCHLKYMNHSKYFWATVEKYCPDYKARKKWLKENGGKLIKRLKKIAN